MDWKLMHTSADTITGYNYQNKGKQNGPQDPKATHMIFIENQRWVSVIFICHKSMP